MSAEAEEWRVIHGSRGCRVSSLGRVHRPDGTPPRIHLNAGYLTVHLGVTRPVHQLVLEAFEGPRPDGMVCRHLNGDKADNRSANLAYGTQADNLRDIAYHKLGLIAPRFYGRRKRTGSPWPLRVSPAQFLDIQRRYDAGESPTLLGREVGVSRTMATNYATLPHYRELGDRLRQRMQQTDPSLHPAPTARSLTATLCADAGGVPSTSEAP